MADAGAAARTGGTRSLRSEDRGGLGAGRWRSAETPLHRVLRTQGQPDPGGGPERHLDRPSPRVVAARAGEPLRRSFLRLPVARVRRRRPPGGVQAPPATRGAAAATIQPPA